ncbi:hypothetical protein MPTK1_5g23920 [Marchantia polymorpha subsp. ruderalis]|uniref:Uncharacterized protein n=2 Tax=Marchantia polymorpha TaxID=3197 RepID=A0AAF6BLM6_MARPO|nr:hypothetical protein MARPO_0010s0065 [Marchantia polymorpha]BBN12910.1 hypothetical protein Mp_5g23920 [Marchantia polymorpha subsp. ruderalis]|eukprot:PTQ46663.1 hypothetical protein MARPO_0010s0065 [Marchantia polymorpha]
MPGLLYNGPFSHHQDTNSAVYGDMLAIENVDYHLDFLNPPNAHLPVPFVPGKHKACWPAQSQTTRLQKMKEDKQAKFLSSGPVNEQSAAKYSNGSNDSEHDLAAMVHEYVENGSCDYWENSDSDNGASTITKFCEILQVLTTPSEPLHRDLLSNVTILVLAINEDTDLIHSSGPSECKGSCTRRFVVMNLRSAGYNAALCKSRWQNSGRVPGGEYEYLDVILEGDRVAEERLIVDIDFKAQFEIARPTPHYLAALQTLPAIFVGTKGKLEQVLDIMSEAAKNSLRQNSMPLPPWRTLDYMIAKWLSNSERRTSDYSQTDLKFPCSVHWRNGIHTPNPVLTKQCGEQLRRTRVSLLNDVKGPGHHHGLPALTHSKGGRAILRPIKSNW